MENRDDDLRARGAPARRPLRARWRSIAITLVATPRMWDAGGLGAIVWLMMIGAGVYAIVGVWRAYREY